MATLADSVKLTYEDYLLLPEDGRRHEIIDGEHFVTPSPSRRHQRVSMNLSRILDTFILEHGLGEVYAAPFDIVLSDLDVVEPDLVFFARDNLEVLTDANARGAPDLAVEILSATTRKRDLVIKRKLFARTGVAEYWVVDPELEAVAVYRGKGELPRVAELSLEEGDKLRSPLFPGLSIPLGEIFG